MINSSFLGIIDRNRHFDGGRGTIANPYRITKIRHLNNVRKYPTASYIQLNDLKFTDEWMNGSLRRGIISDYDTTGYGEQSGCYFDTQATNGATGGRVGATGRTTAQMTWPYDMDNFPVYVDWDFDTIWAHDTDGTVNDGYPYLRGVTPVTTTE